MSLGYYNIVVGVVQIMGCTGEETVFDQSDVSHSSTSFYLNAYPLKRKNKRKNKESDYKRYPWVECATGPWYLYFVVAIIGFFFILSLPFFLWLKLKRNRHSLEHGPYPLIFIHNNK